MGGTVKKSLYNVYSMEIVRHKAPRLPKTTMVCDNCIDDKLEKYEAVKDNFSKAFFTLVVGRMGQGKTSTVISLMKGIFRRVFADIFVIIPAISLQSIAPEDNVFALLPEDNVYHDFTEETMSDIEKKVMENSAHGDNSLLIIDDFGSAFANEKDPANKILKRMAIKIRHMKCSIMLLQQNIFQLPKKLREVATSLLMFDLGVSQNEKVIKEILPYNQKQCEEIMEAFESPHDHIILNTRSHRLFRNLQDELVFNKTV
jgi:DNA replication protein DnaC